MIRRFVQFAIWLGAIGSVQANLLVHLPFDRDGVDATGSGRNAKANNGASVDRKNFLIGNGAASFDGESAYYSIPIFTPVVGDGARSVSCWVRGAGASGTSPNDIFIGWGDIGSAPRVRFDFGLEMTNDSRVRVEFNADAVVSTAEDVDFLDGAWHHLLITYDTKTVVFFVDGKPYGDALPRTVPLETGVSTAGTAIGAGVREASGRAGDPKRCFNGRIDDVGIWGESLSATDAALLNGLGRIGGNNLGCLAAARELWRQKTGALATFGDQTWRKVSGLPGNAGDWVQSGGPNGAGSFIVLSHSGEGLRISPRWWESSAVRVAGLGLVFLIGLGLCGWLYYRMTILVRLRRVEAKDRMEAERRRIAQDLHDDLGSGLTEIMSLGDLAEQECRSPGELKARLAEITAKTRDLVGAVDEIVWTANPVNDLVPKLASYLCDYAVRFLRAKGIHARLEVAESLPAIQVNARARHHILMAVKEALNNAVKHSRATEVWLRIRCDAGELCIVVEDNGRGFDLEAVQRGNGLANLRSRMEELGGNADIETRPGQGVNIHFRLPLKNLIG